MKKKLLSVVLSTAMVASLLVGCGSKTEEAPAATDEATDEATDAATDEATDAATDEATDAATDEEADVELPEDTGKVLNIYTIYRQCLPEQPGCYSSWKRRCSSR